MLLADQCKVHDVLRKPRRRQHALHIGLEKGGDPLCYSLTHLQQAGEVHQVVVLREGREAAVEDKPSAVANMNKQQSELG